MKFNTPILLSILLATSCSSYASVQNLYYCKGESSITHKKFHVTIAPQKIGPATYQVHWGQPKGTISSKNHTNSSSQLFKEKRVDQTTWFVIGNRGTATFHGATPKIGQFYTGSSALIFNKNRLETLFSGYSLLKNGKLIRTAGHMFCVGK